MIAVDTNILVHAHRRDSLWYAAAYRTMQTLSESADTWAIPWPCIHEFLSVVTKAKAFIPPTPLEKALDQVDAWLASPSLVTFHETKDHWAQLSSMLRSS